MQPEMKAKWVAALRSGDYIQKTGCLKKEDGFCCLGVLCDIVDPTGWASEPSHYGEHKFSYETIYPMTGISNIDSSFGSLPSTLNDELGITSEQEEHLVSMNDDENLDFMSIADWIEENL